MPESILLSDPRVEPKRKKSGEAGRRLESYSGTERLEGEVLPPDEFYTFFPVMEEMLIAEQERFGLTRRSSEKAEFSGRSYIDGPCVKTIDPDRIHYLPSEVYSAQGNSHGESFGVYLIGEQSIHIAEYRAGLEHTNLSPERKQSVRLRSLQHEAVHMVSYEADYLGKKGDARLYRQGYMVFNQKYGFERFRGLNEAVVERINMIVFNSAIPKLMERFPDTKEKDWRFGQPIYEEYRTVLGDIIENIAECMHRDALDVWYDFEKGMFTGDMMHLKNVDRVYGPGSLRLLSAMGTYEGDTVAKKHPKTETRDWRDMLDEQFLNYFERYGQTWEKRKRIAKEVLSEKEFQRFEVLSNGGRRT